MELRFWGAVLLNYKGLFTHLEFLGVCRPCPCAPVDHSSACHTLPCGSLCDLMVGALLLFIRAPACHPADAPASPAVVKKEGGADAEAGAAESMDVDAAPGPEAAAVKVEAGLASPAAAMMAVDEEKPAAAAAAAAGVEGDEGKRRAPARPASELPVVKKTRVAEPESGACAPGEGGWRLWLVPIVLLFSRVQASSSWPECSAWSRSRAHRPESSQLA